MASAFRSPELGQRVLGLGTDEADEIGAVGADDQRRE
jgi:hypothetical protein